MNDGILALIVQWCLLCLVWMGVFDTVLHRIHQPRSKVLAVIACYLLCSFSNWRLYALPLEISLSGSLLPLLTAGWMWSRLVTAKRHHVMALAITLTCLLVFAKKMLFLNPVLLWFEEASLFPVLVVLLLLVFTWNPGQQVFLLFFSLPVADLLYVVGNLGKIPVGVVGDRSIQDALWLSFALWGGVAACIVFVKKCWHVIVKPK